MRLPLRASALASLRNSAALFLAALAFFACRSDGSGEEASGGHVSEDATEPLPDPAGSAPGPTTPHTVGSSHPPADETPLSADDALPCIAPLIVERCAFAGCHDSQTREHAMNLSSGSSIYAAWLGMNGLDHCSQTLIPRVVPGDPDASYVLMRLLGTLTCPEAPPMPPPPLLPLSDEEIDSVRQWIVDGAQRDCSVVDVRDAGVFPSPETPDVPACTVDDPCTGGECLGSGCRDPWDCFFHHECSEEIVIFCGCDGTSFQSSKSCPIRSYAYAGVCGAGVSCDQRHAYCGEPPPACGKGELPSIEGECWGECVPESYCRCYYDWDCPHSTHRCFSEEQRCVPRETDAGLPPRSDGGSQRDGDGGTP